MKINGMVIIVVSLTLALVVGLAGCIAQPTKTVTITPGHVTLPAATPTLSKETFTLSDPTSLSHTIPIYVKNNQTLHLHWEIIGGENSLWIAFNTPNGHRIGVADMSGKLTDCGIGGGVVIGIEAGAVCGHLTCRGDITFSPLQYGWGEGYYYFNPFITSKDPDTIVGVYYWIED